MRVLLTLTLLLTTLQAINLRLTNKVISDADKQAILNANDDDAFDQFLVAYDDLEDSDFKLSASPAAMKTVRAEEKKIFLANLNKIKEHNKRFARGETTFDMTINSFAVMDEESLNMFNGLNFTESRTTGKYETTGRLKFQVSAGDSLPSSLDWRQRGWMTEAKNQNACGSCWTFVTIGILEFAYYACTGNKIQLSEQELLDCTYESTSGRNGCGGGSIWRASDWLAENNHLAKMSDYPYTAKDGTCSYQSYSSAIKNVLKVTGYTRIAGYDRNKPAATENQLMQAVQTRPIAVKIYAEDAFKRMGKNNLYDQCKHIPEDKKLNHALVLTGYAETYWAIKNSWGADWSDNGFGRLTRTNGGNICNILMDAFTMEFEDLDTSDGLNPEDVEDDEEGNENIWIDVTLGKQIPWQLDTVSLEIQTLSAVDPTASDAMVYIAFRVTGSDEMYNLMWRYSDWKVSINGCTGYWEESMSNVPFSETMRVWRITKSAEELQIYCDEVLVYSKKFADCWDSGTDWSQEISSMMFGSDSATQFYRAPETVTMETL